MHLQYVQPISALLLRYECDCFLLTLGFSSAIHVDSLFVSICLLDRDHYSDPELEQIIRFGQVKNVEL